ncbi:MAG: fibronectin type III domain-containing protein, partial [DPANN group archaeon]|nr:fibronectin type III domain-containing protein [DPANN group archaeon]
ESNSATITWTTDESANSSVNYGVTDSLGTTAGSITLATAHSINLAGLIDGVTYYYNVTSCDAAPNCNTTGPLSFSTTAIVAPPPAEPTVGGGSGEIGGTSAGFLSTPGAGLDISTKEFRLSIAAGSAGNESVLLTNYATVPIEIILAKHGLENIPIKVSERVPELYFANEPTAKSRQIELQDSNFGFSETTITLNPSETKQLNILFEPLERGVYTGGILIKWGLVGTSAHQTFDIPVILEVGQVGKLFDISLNIPSTFKKLFSGNTLRTQVNLLNVGSSDEMKDVTIDYEIKDFENNILHKESETIAVGREKSYLKSIELPELEPGKYVLIAELTYSGEYAAASNTFEIVTTGLLPAIMQKPEYLAGLAGLIVVILILANIRIINANRRVITNRRKSKSHKAQHKH